MVTTPPRPRLRVKGVRIAMMCRRTVSKIDDFSSKLIVKKSTRRLCNGSETTRKTRENRSFFVEIECQKINTLVLQLRAASTSYAKLQNLVESKSVILTRSPCFSRWLRRGLPGQPGPGHRCADHSSDASGLLCKDSAQRACRGQTLPRLNAS